MSYFQNKIVDLCYTYLMIMNKSILAWLYYNKLHPDRYDDMDDYEQRRKAERAFTKLKNLDMDLFINCLVIYYDMMVLDIQDIIKDKSPKPNDKGE